MVSCLLSRVENTTVRSYLDLTIVATWRVRKTHSIGEPDVLCEVRRSPLMAKSAATIRSRYATIGSESRIGIWEASAMFTCEFCSCYEPCLNSPNRVRSAMLRKARFPIVKNLGNRSFRTPHWCNCNFAVEFCLVEMKAQK